VSTSGFVVKPAVKDPRKQLPKNIIKEEVSAQESSKEIYLTKRDTIISDRMSFYSDRLLYLKEANIFRLTPKKISIYLINILAVAGFVYGTMTIFAIDQRSKEALGQRLEAREIAQSIEPSSSTSYALAPLRTAEDKTPAKIEINSIGVEAPIDVMGVTEDNSIEAPTNMANAGWFNGSVLPGEEGTTIIDGHMGGNIVPGVFTYLENVEIGDSIKVVSKDGEITNYVIRKTKTFDRNSQEFDELYETVGDGNGLNLITCTGGWLPSAQTYDSRLIVYAEQVFA